MTTTESQTIAAEILNQLGGSRFVAMTGAKMFTSGDRSLRFRLPSRFATNGINFVRIILTDSDDYAIEYGKVWGLKYQPLGMQTGIYADTLRASFTAATGLDCTL
jgi:hypothetical protein